MVFTFSGRVHRLSPQVISRAHRSYGRYSGSYKVITRHEYVMFAVAMEKDSVAGIVYSTTLSPTTFGPRFSLRQAHNPTATSFGLCVFGAHHKSRSALALSSLGQAEQRELLVIKFMASHISKRVKYQGNRLFRSLYQPTYVSSRCLVPIKVCLT